MVETRVVIFRHGINDEYARRLFVLPRRVGRYQSRSRTPRPPIEFIQIVNKTQHCRSSRDVRRREGIQCNNVAIYFFLSLLLIIMSAGTTTRTTLYYNVMLPTYAHDTAAVPIRHIDRSSSTICV